MMSVLKSLYREIHDCQVSPVIVAVAESDGKVCVRLILHLPT